MLSYLTPCATRYALVALEALPACTAGVKQFEDTPLAELMIGNLDTTRGFVHRVLGAVLRLPEEFEQLSASDIRAGRYVFGAAGPVAIRRRL